MQKRARAKSPNTREASTLLHAREPPRTSRETREQQHLSSSAIHKTRCRGRPDVHARTQQQLVTPSTFLATQSSYMKEESQSRSRGVLRVAPAVVKSHTARKKARQDAVSFMSCTPAAAGGSLIRAPPCIRTARPSSKSCIRECLRLGLRLILLAFSRICVAGLYFDAGTFFFTFLIIQWICVLYAS